MLDEELPAGRELDESVAESVFGMTRGVGFGVRPEGHEWRGATTEEERYDDGPLRYVCDRCARRRYSDDGPNDFPCDRVLSAYSTFRLSATAVEQRMFDAGYQCHTYGCKHTTDAPWAATFAKGPNSYHASAQTVEHAIALAALKAKRAEAKHG